MNASFFLVYLPKKHLQTTDASGDEPQYSKPDNYTSRATTEPALQGGAPQGFSKIPGQTTDTRIDGQREQRVDAAVENKLAGERLPHREKLRQKADKQHQCFDVGEARKYALNVRRPRTFRSTRG